MPLNETIRKRIYHYAYQGHRETEPVFVGREKEITTINDGINMARDGYHKGRTICLSGPPGIGKTALLEECRQQIEQNHSAIWVPVHSSVLHNPDAVVLAVAEAMSKIPKDRIARSGLRRCAKIVKTSGREMKAEAALGGGLGNIKVVTDLTKKDKPQPAKGPLSAAPWRTLGQLRDTITDKPPFVFSIDEAHKLKGSNGNYGTCNDLLQALHEGGPVPIIPIFAGHVHTPEVIEESISQRLVEEQNLFMANLSKSESKDYVFGILDHLEADGDFDTIADWIYDESNGFPHHIRGSLSSIAKGMLQANSLRLADLDTKAVEQDFSRGRKNYYAKRLRPPLRDYRKVISAVLQEIKAPGELFDDEIIEMLENGMQNMIKSGNSQSHPIDKEALFDALVYRGAIARTSEDTYTCLIHSLAQYADSKNHAPYAPFPVQNPRPQKGNDSTMCNS